MKLVPHPEENVLEIANLSRRFGSKAALSNVSLSIPRGSVFGLVGENGAGKSTLIKHVLGLWRAESGSVRVFSQDPVANPVAVLSRIGYLSEQPDLPEWMRVHEFLRYMRAFYPKWDPVYAESLRQQFGLDPSARIRILSKGQRAKLGLLAAQAHRPDLLLLDEPSSGLDPIVRNDILAAVIRTVAEEGRTVFFSSHLLEEIERVSDHVVMLHHGRLVLSGPIDAIKSQFRRVRFRFEESRPTLPTIRGALTVTGSDRECTVICDSNEFQPRTMAADLHARLIDDEAASLNDIFIAHAGRASDYASLPVGAHA